MKTKEFGRKRGYYRAVKRKESWALAKEAQRLSNPSWILWWVYHGAQPLLEQLVYSKNPFMALIEKGTDWAGTYLPIPLNYD